MHWTQDFCRTDISLILSKHPLYAPPWTDPHTTRWKKEIWPFPLCPSQFMAWPLLQSTLRSRTNPLSQCPLWKGSVLFFQFQSKTSLAVYISCLLPNPDLDPIHWTSSVPLNPPSVLSFTLTPSWESYRSLEPAIKSVNGSNTQTHA